MSTYDFESLNENKNCEIDSLSTIINLSQGFFAFSSILIATSFFELSLMLEASIDFVSLIVLFGFTFRSFPKELCEGEKISNLEFYHRVSKYPTYWIILDVLHFKRYFFSILLVANVFLYFSPEYSYESFKKSLLITFIIFLIIYILTIIYRYMYYIITRHAEIQRLTTFYSETGFPLTINKQKEYFLSALEKKLAGIPAIEDEFRLSKDNLIDLIRIGKEMGIAMERCAWKSPLQVYFDNRILDSVFKEQKAK
jgi:hypothetical protein